MATVGGGFPPSEAVSQAHWNPIIGGSRNASPVVAQFPAYVSAGLPASIRRSGVISTRRHDSATQAELNARRR
jgi:hypothetical protein